MSLPRVTPCGRGPKQPANTFGFSHARCWARASSISSSPASTIPSLHRRRRRLASVPFLQRTRCLREIARAARRRQVGQGIGTAKAQWDDMVAFQWLICASEARIFLRFCAMRERTGRPCLDSAFSPHRSPRVRMARSTADLQALLVAAGLRDNFKFVVFR
jgi:hypothetical protein